MLTGENGILTQAQKAKEETERAQEEEEGVLDNYSQYIEGSTNGGTLTTITGNEETNTKVQDSLGNIITVPAGFRIVNPGDNVEDGIIIEDISHGATKGSQFIWIPVGTVHIKDKEDITIKLSRYIFEKDGTPIDQGEEPITWGGYNFSELNTSNGNATAKEDIESENVGFRKSVKDNGGYYIGRYEARTAIERKAKTDSETQITLKPNEYVYNYVTQHQASKLSQEMYANSNFTSDLMNSYAWDTAIDFLQKCDDREGDNLLPYSMQYSLNTGSIEPLGTNNLERKDIICNIYDMASNCIEWTTDTCDKPDYPCVNRGGYYDFNGYYTSNRYSNPLLSSDVRNAFRPLLYL